MNFTLFFKSFLKEGSVYMFFLFVIILCIIGFVEVSKYSCNNGVYLDFNKAEKDTTTNFNDIIQVCILGSGGDSKKMSDCLTSKLDYAYCADNTGWLVTLIIITVLSCSLMVGKLWLRPPWRGAASPLR